MSAGDSFENKHHIISGIGCNYERFIINGLLRRLVGGRTRFAMPILRRVAATHLNARMPVVAAMAQPFPPHRPIPDRIGRRVQPFGGLVIWRLAPG
jgi:hypothetical protein